MKRAVTPEQTTAGGAARRPSAAAPASVPRRRTYPRYRAVFGLSFCCGMLLAVPVILLGPGHDGSFVRGAATALAVVALAVLVRHQGALYVGQRGLYDITGCWLRRLVRWSEVQRVELHESSMSFVTRRGVLRVDTGIWHWRDLLEAIAARLDPAVAVPLRRGAAPRHPDLYGIARGQWAWPTRWGFLLFLALAGIIQLLTRVESGDLQARLYFQGTLCLLGVLRIVLSSRQAMSLLIHADGIRVQTAGEPYSVPLEELLAVVDCPHRWVIRTIQGDFEVKRSQQDGKAVHDTLVRQRVPRVIYEPGPRHEWLLES